MYIGDSLAFIYGNMNMEVRVVTPLAAYRHLQECDNARAEILELVLSRVIAKTVSSLSGFLTVLRTVIAANPHALLEHLRGVCLQLFSP